MYDHLLLQLLMLCVCFFLIFLAGNNALSGFFGLSCFLFLYRINHEGIRFCNSPKLDLGGKYLGLAFRFLLFIEVYEIT